jgi:putative two-component system response regulator
MSTDAEHLPTVLVVDDAPANLSLLAGLLNKACRVKLASSGAKALELVRRAAPDLILLDVMMPEMDGYEVCRQLKAAPLTARIPVLFLTAMSQPEDEAKGFAVGGADFIHKPISPAIVQARVRTHLQMKAYQDELTERNAWLHTELAKRLAQVDQLREATLHVMISFAEFRDEETGNHVRRTQEYVRVLATHLHARGAYPELLNPESIEHIAKSAPLHDIGKVAIPDHILLKPGRLDADEMAIMRQHAMHGWEMLHRAAQRMGEAGGAADAVSHGAADSTSRGETGGKAGGAGPGFLDHAMDIARCHHEKWDGSGYPDGLLHENIPLSARLMAVADVYDALISRRPYKEPMPHERAVAFIHEGRGKHFDPAVVDAFDQTMDEFVRIAQTWRDD